MKICQNESDKKWIQKNFKNIEWKTLKKNVKMTSTFLILAEQNDQDYTGVKPEAVFLVVFDPSMNELWVT